MEKPNGNELREKIDMNQLDWLIQERTAPLQQEIGQLLEKIANLENELKQKDEVGDGSGYAKFGWERPKEIIILWKIAIKNRDRTREPIDFFR